MKVYRIVKNNIIDGVLSFDKKLVVASSDTHVSGMHCNTCMAVVYAWICSKLCI